MAELYPERGCPATCRSHVHVPHELGAPARQHALSEDLGDNVEDRLALRYWASIWPPAYRRLAQAYLYQTRRAHVGRAAHQRRVVPFVMFPHAGDDRGSLLIFFPLIEIPWSISFLF